MFPLLIAAFALLLGWGLWPWVYQGGPFNPLPTFLAILPGAGIVAVVVQWFSNPGGIKDFTQGGVVGFKDTPYQLTWYDWAIFMTRKGTIDKNSKILRLQRKLLFGLIPLKTVVRPLGEFYRVKVDVHQATAANRRRDRSLFGDGRVRGGEVVRIDYKVCLVDRSAGDLVVLDVSCSPYLDRGGRLCGDLREALEGIMGVPGARPARRKIAPAQPHADDYETWLKKKQERGET